MEKFRIEYFIVFEHNGSFCNNENSFDKLLESNSDIIIDKEQLTYKNEKFMYKRSCNDVKDKNQRYFKIRIEFEDENYLNIFHEFQKAFRDIIYKAKGVITTIWDDISSYYSIKAYPEINRIENLLRKVITSSMIINLGLDWIKETKPDDITIKNNKDKFDVDYLHQMDFIHLSIFLTKEYSNNNVVSLYKELSKVDNKDDINLELLKSYIPKSNWDRYFKSIVNYESQQLESKWSKLYDYRCLIAHNNFLKKHQYDEILSLVKELTEVFDKALENIDKIIVPKSEQNQLFENIITSHENFQDITEIYGKFLNRMCTIYSLKIGPISDVMIHFPSIAYELVIKGAIDTKLYKQLVDFKSDRNVILHNGIVSVQLLDSLKEKGNILIERLDKQINKYKDDPNPEDLSGYGTDLIVENPAE